MPEITAATVKALREQTGLPMMDCKKALTETSGDPVKAVEWLRKQGKKFADKRAGRSTTSGRIVLNIDAKPGVGTMIDLRCESAPVANNEQFIGLANAMAKQLAIGPGADSPAALLEQPSPDHAGQTLGQVFEDLNNRIREAFNLERIVRIRGTCAGYVHHNGAVAVLLHYEGGDADLARDICMHIAAMKPVVLQREELDQAAVAKEREMADQVISKEIEGIETEAKRLLSLPDEQMQDPSNLQRTIGSHARANNELRKVEGLKRNKPKVIEGRMGVYYGERCLLEQPHANPKHSGKSIQELAKAAGMKIHRFVHWELPKE